MGGACQNDVTGLAEKGEGGGGCEGRLRAVTASGYPRARGGGGREGVLSPSVFNSCSTLSFNFSFACFWLAVRLSLDKKLSREDPNKLSPQKKRIRYGK
jgi:hypothetical protein